MPLVTMPDGQTVQMPDKLTPDLAARLQAFRSRAPQENPKQGATAPDPIHDANAQAAAEEHGPVQDVIDMVKGIPGGAVDAVKSIPKMVTGSGIAGLPAAALQAAPKVANALKHPLDTAKAGAEAVRNLTPQKVGNLIGQAATPALAGKVAGGVGRIAEEAATAPRAATSMVDVAREHGYVLKPSEAGGKVGKVVEGLSGSPKLSVEASIKNQKVTNRLAGEEIGVPGRLTKGAIAEAKKPHNAVYKEMQGLGDIATDAKYKADIESIGRTPGTSFEKAVNPDLQKLRDAYDEMRFDSKDAVLKIRELRAASTKNIKAPFDPAKNDLGYAQKQIADAIESQMERHAAALGKSDLVTRFRQARQSLAKIRAVESSIRGNTAEVSAPALAKQLERGVPLSGKLKVIADVANEFGEVTREGRKLKNKVPVTVLEGASGALGAGAATLHHPVAGGAALIGMIARPLARKALLSKAYQDRLAKAKAPHQPDETGVVP